MVINCNLGQEPPIFEIPKETYTGKEILRILCDKKISQDKICRECPRQITKSCTFVVDLDELKHPDDIKDEFGKWQYAGSRGNIHGLEVWL